MTVLQIGPMQLWPHHRGVVPRRDGLPERDWHRAARSDPQSADFPRLRQLDTLLLGAEANCRGLGAELVVVTARA